MLWLILSLTGLLGLLILTLGLRGRRINDHPLCRRCRFDLVGLYPGRDACPECGGSLINPRAVRTGQRRRRAGLAATGAAILLVTIGAVATFGWTAAKSFNWNTIKPTRLLAMDLTSVDPQRALAAVAELGDRIAADGFSKLQADAVAGRILARQADPTLPWSREFADLLRSLRTRGLLSDAAWLEYLHGAVAFRPNVPLAVRAGEPLVLTPSVTHSLRGTGRESMIPYASPLKLEVDRVDVLPLALDEMASVMPLTPGGRASTRLTIPLPEGITGRARVHSRWLTAVLPTEYWDVPISDFFITDDAGNEVPRPEYCRILEFVHELLILDSAGPAAILDPEVVTSWLADNMATERCVLEPRAAGMLLRVALIVPNPPIEIAATATIRATINGKPVDLPAGSVHFLPGAARTQVLRAPLPPGTTLDSPAHIDIVLRSDPHARPAEAGAQLWEGELSIPRVEIQLPRR